jgi:CRISPR-associated endonuclease Cas2
MAVLLVTYDLNKEGKSKVDYNKFYKLRNSYNYARLSESSYALQTDESPDTVFNKMRAVIDENDFIYIINLKRPYTGFGLEEVNNWLANYLPF